MVVEDIGYMLFVQFLGMTEYPGAPFTANIVKDLILFLFVPMVFIIAVVYMLTMRIFPGEYGKMRLLFGLAAFFVILVSGFYKMFAYIAGVYFVFVIIIMGLLFFLGRHFRRGETSGGGTFRNALGMSGHAPDGTTDYVRLGEIDADMKRLKAELNIAREKGSKDEAALFASKIENLKDEEDIIKKRMQPWKKYVR